MFVVAFLARLIGQLLVGAFAHPETWEYEAVANNILAGRGYAYDSGGITYVASQSSPLYILLTAFVYLVTAHSQTAMLLVQDVLGATTAALASWVAVRLFSRPVALLAGLLVALDPGLVAYAAKLHSLSLDTLAFVGVAFVTLMLPTAPGWRQLALLGAAIGIAGLTRASALCLLPVVLIWLARYRGLRLFSPGAVIAVGLAVLVYAPWPIHNSLMLGEFVAGSSESTEWLWRGTNPNATGSSYAAGNRLMLDDAPDDFRARVASASEAQRIDLYRDAALSSIRDRPLQAVQLYLAKLKAFWWGSDATGLFYPGFWVAVYYAWYVPVLCIAAWGGFAAWHGVSGRPAAVLLLASMVAISLAQSVFYVEGRHRLAVEPLLLIFSGGGLLALARAWTTNVITRLAQDEDALPTPSVGPRRCRTNRGAYRRW